MQDFIDEFNSFFVDAEITTSDQRLYITIGEQTMVVQLPGVIGVQGKPVESND